MIPSIGTTVDNSPTSTGTLLCALEIVPKHCEHARAPPALQCLGGGSQEGRSVRRADAVAMRNDARPAYSHRAAAVASRPHSPHSTPPQKLGLRPAQQAGPRTLATNAREPRYDPCAIFWERPHEMLCPAADASRPRPRRRPRFACFPRRWADRPRNVHLRPPTQARCPCVSCSSMRWRPMSHRRRPGVYDATRK